MQKTLCELLEDIQNKEQIYNFVLEQNDSDVINPLGFHYENNEGEYSSTIQEDSVRLVCWDDDLRYCFPLGQISEASFYENGILAIDDNGNGFNLIPLIRLTMSKFFA